MTSRHAAVAADHRVSPHDRRIAAKNDVNNPNTPHLSCSFTMVSSLPLRGIATPSVCVGGYAVDRPHCPYEGSQHGRCAEVPGCLEVLIVPTRDRNPVSSMATLIPRAVLIAPTRDRNAAAQNSQSPAQPGPHCLYEGSQRKLADLVLIAPEKRVLIAPARDRNILAVSGEQSDKAVPWLPWGRPGAVPV